MGILAWVHEDLRAVPPFQSTGLSTMSFSDLLLLGYPCSAASIPAGVPSMGCLCKMTQAHLLKLDAYVQNVYVCCAFHEGEKASRTVVAGFCILWYDWHSPLRRGGTGSSPGSHFYL